MSPLQDIQNKIAKAKASSGLAANHVTLLGASKGQATPILASFIEQGLRHFGENRVQEAALKWPELRKLTTDLVLHLIGPLQTNKVREALALFDVIQTIDRPKLAEAIASCQVSGNRCQKFFIQVNTGEEPQKAGVTPKEAGGFIGYCRNDLKLPVVGLMCIPPLDQQPAPHFALLRKLAADNGLSEISMGMSGDYETAVRMGSSCVRIGTALFGARD